MKHHIILLVLACLFIWAIPKHSFGQTFTITASDHNHISLRFNFNDFSIDTIRCEGELMHTIVTKGIVAPNEYGQPDLPTFSRFIAIPQGAQAIVEVRTSRDERMSGINIAPAIGSQCENDADRPFYKDQKAYTNDGLYPAAAYRVAEPQQLRGVDVIHLGLCPIQFDPLKQEIAIHRQFDIDIRFEGGNGHFGDDRLRSPYWDPILRNNILNYNCLPPIDYAARMQEWSRTRPTGCEYLIVTPDNDAYVEAMQELVNLRRRQGILTDVMRITEIGNDENSIKQGFRNIYNHWDIPPAAVCLVGESGQNLQNYVLGYETPHPKDGYITSDNPYADINDDYLPDICFTRLIAQNESELPLFIGKQIEYEYTNPVMDSYYYDHPITAAGWQDSKWFQITIATISGYLTQHGKIPSRINEVYSGGVGADWSTASGTNAVVSYFGPEGVGYIPATPAELGGWTGGNASHVMTAINQGAYLIQHRDHGWNNKWYQPEIYVSDFGSINNPGLMAYLISVNCRTGMYYDHNTTFLEGLMRMTRNGQNAGIVGAIAPAGQTYSYANDIYLWGVWDLFDSSFLPEYGPFADHADAWLPAFANVSGKYFLETQVFPSTNADMRSCTYNTFHTHGDAFLRIFTEVPQPIETEHDATLACYAPFHITAPQGSQIALTENRDGQIRILATAIGTGETQTLTVMENLFSETVHLTITGLNLLRHEEDIYINPIGQPLVVVDSISVNGSGMTLHYGQSASTDIVVTNVGENISDAGTVILTTDSEYLNIIQGETQLEALPGGGSLLLEDAFQFEISDSTPDGTHIPITVTTHFGYGTHERNYELSILSPTLTTQFVEIDDSAGNGDGYLDPGEFATLTFRITNNGHYLAENSHITLSNNEGYARIITPETTIANLETGSSTDISFDIFVEFIAGEAPYIHFTLNTLTYGISQELEYACPIGFIEESFENGLFTHGYWTNDTDHPWTIDNSNSYDGDFSAKSGHITHNETSLLTFNYTSYDVGYFTFFSSVSSENNYDFLNFYIDGELQDHWSGERPWEEHTYRILPGRHVYAWRYSKDYSVDGGYDAAWVDYIILPYHLDETNERAIQPLTLHPNPTTDKIAIDVNQDGDLMVQVFDSNGRCILAERNARIISMKDKPAGAYRIVITLGQQCWSQTIIKL